MTNAQCPYCYNGEIIYDKYSDTFYCNRCKNTVKIINYKDDTENKE